MGPHVNAYTSFDETVYQFELPTNREGVVEKGLQALADFAGGMLLTPAEIDKERGVVDRRVARRPRRRIAPARPADPGPLLPVQVRRTPADREARDPEGVHARSAEGLLHEMVSAGSHGSGRGRRSRSAEDGGDDSNGVRSAREAGDGGAAAIVPVPLPSEVLYKVATDPEATQSSVSIVQKRAREPQDRVGGLPPHRSSTSSCSRC